MSFYKHDIEDVLNKFYSMHDLSWPCAHCTNLEEIYKNETSLHEVEAKIGKKKKET